MDFALYKTLVDAMSGHPLVVTIGCPGASGETGSRVRRIFAMNSAATSFTPQRFARLRLSVCGLVYIALLAADNFVFQSKAADAGSATAQFHVSARVIRSCHVSPQTIIEQQGVTANVPVNVKCDKNDPSRNSCSGACTCHGELYVGRRVGRI
jgi:hypothetical protein